MARKESNLNLAVSFAAVDAKEPFWIAIQKVEIIAMMKNLFRVNLTQNHELTVGWTYQSALRSPSWRRTWGSFWEKPSIPLAKTMPKAGYTIPVTANNGSDTLSTTIKGQTYDMQRMHHRNIEASDPS